MLASPHSQIHERHRNHRRQNSTPSTLDAVNAASLAKLAVPRYATHRRGQSFDQRSIQSQQHRLIQDRLRGMSTTNTYGNESTLADLVVQDDNDYFNGDDFFSRSSQLKTEIDLDVAYFPSDGFDFRQQTTQSPPTAAPGRSQLQQRRGSEVPLVDAPNAPASPEMFQSRQRFTVNQQSPSISEIVRRSSIQSELTSHYQNRRPHTPQKQTSATFFPMTPATTPFKPGKDLTYLDADMQMSPTKVSNSAVSRTSQSEFMQRAKSLQGVTGTMFTQQKIEVPSPPATVSFDIDHLDMLDCYPGSSHEEVLTGHRSQSQHSSSSSIASSTYTHPELADMPSPAESIGSPRKMPIYPATPRRMSPKKLADDLIASSPTKPKLSPRVASIDSLNLDARIQASIKETGISIDEIASFIHGPDPEDGKWVCLHPGCGRRFGRKENIKSHVQTHLGDRQFKCDHCHKCFVRGHDLKRHAKIHTGDKPYECLCGNVFARQDALTRHRQRGMCIGGYQGIVRKMAKRGRPKKHRPEMEERQDKAARTRQRLAERSYSPSVSESDYGHDSPPSDIFETLSIRESSPVDDMPVFQTPNYALPPEAFTFTPPASPGRGTETKPSHRRVRSALTPISEDELLPPSSIKLEDVLGECQLPSVGGTMRPLNFDLATLSDAKNMSSPRSAPALTESSAGSDLDIFISEEPSLFCKDGLEFDDAGLISLHNCNDTSTFDGTDLEMFSAKEYISNEAEADDLFSFTFPAHSQISDALCNEFLLK